MTWAMGIDILRLYQLICLNKIYMHVLLIFVAHQSFLQMGYTSLILILHNAKSMNYSLSID